MRKKSSARTKQQKQLEAIVGTMIGLVVILIVIIIFAHFSNNFTYRGIVFKKTKYGDIIIYSTNVPIFDSYGRVVRYTRIDFRNDPRALRNVPVNLDGSIKFIKENTAYLSVNPETEDCEDSGIGVVNLGLFLKKSGLNTKLGSMDQNHAAKEIIPYITCAGKSDTNTVVLIKKSDQTKITELYDNCYEIQFKDCEVLEATETFILEIIRQHTALIN